MPAHVQTCLLRVLEGREVTRLGANARLPLDARIIAASNRDPLEAVQSGVLRADLYYRLAEFSIFVPPLSARRGDVGFLAHHFVNLINAQHGFSRHLSAASLLRLDEHHWPGKVRKLRHVIGRACVMAKDPVLEAWPEMCPVTQAVGMAIQPGQTLGRHRAARDEAHP